MHDLCSKRLVKVLIFSLDTGYYLLSVIQPCEWKTTSNKRGMSVKKNKCFLNSP